MIGDRKFVALCTSRIYDQQVHSFIEAFSEETKTHGMRLAVFSISMDRYWVEDDDSADSSVFNFIPYSKTDLIIIMDEKIKSHRISGDIIAAAKEHGKPVIVIDGTYPGCMSIRFDFRKGFESVVRHLFDVHGITHPHFMAGFRGNAFSEERIQVFKDILAEKNIPFDDSMISYGDFWAGPARAAAKELLKRETLPDAVICANDIMAINVSDVLKTAGIDVPEEILISGFDGMNEAFLASPSITTASCDLSEMAKAVAEAAELCMSGPGSPADELLVTPMLIPNESCGCPRCRDKLSSALSRFNDGFYRYQDDIRVMHNSITGMMSADTVKDLGTFIQGVYTSHACCIVDSSCFSIENNYFLTDDSGSDYCLLYDPSIEEGGLPSFNIEELMPHMEERLASGYPLLIQSLDYINKPMGYICYFFENYDITEYGKTANITEMVSMGLGGYITMKYQQYLLKKVEEIYQLDALTGLYNRLAFQEAFDAMKADPENQGRPLLVVMTDLDRLKKINDTLGHAAGDQAIAAVAHALKKACPKEALCVRFGGDEMLAFIPGETGVEEISERIEALLSEASVKYGFRITASCGCCQAVIREDISAEELIALVDEEMYTIKRISHAKYDGTK